MRFQSRYPTQAAFAARLGITQGSLSKLERGLIRPDMEILRRVARAGGRSLDELASAATAASAAPAAGVSTVAVAEPVADAVARLFADVPEAGGILLRHLRSAFEEIERIARPDQPMETSGARREPAGGAYSGAPEAWDGWLARQQLPAPLLREAFPVRRAAVLDVGCGTGRNTLALADLGYEATGVEPEPALLDAARRLPALQDRLASGRLPGLHDALGRRFDGVLCAGVLQELPPPQVLPAVMDLAGLLRPHGSLLVTVPTERPRAGRRKAPPFHPLPADDLECLFRYAGLRVRSRRELDALPGRPTALVLQAARA